MTHPDELRRKAIRNQFTGLRKHYNRIKDQVEITPMFLPWGAYERIPGFPIHRPLEQADAAAEQLYAVGDLMNLLAAFSEHC